MQQVKLEVEVRNEKGKGVVRELRRLGIIPGVVYGHEFDSIPIQLPKKKLQTLMESGSGGENVLIELTIGDKTPELALLKEVQRHPITHNLIHADFMRISLEETVSTHIPIVLKGTPIGVAQQSGVMGFLQRELEVECLPTQIPEQITLEVSNLGIGDSIRVSDLQVPEGVEVLDDPETTIVTISSPAILKEEEAAPTEAAEEAEPEVIGAKDKEEEDEKAGGESR